MAKDKIRHFFLRVMVWNMRWMTRYLGFIARPIVRLYGANEIIACGLRDTRGRVCIIFTQGKGQSGQSVFVLQNREWRTSAFRKTKHFSGSLVFQWILPDANIGERYRMRGARASGRRISSPVITIKKETACEDSLLQIQKSSGSEVVFSWQDADYYDPMIYFLALEDDKGKTLAAIYTRENFWTYPKIKKASYSLGPQNPPPLASKKRYTAKLVLVDYDGWVSHIAEKEFFL